VTPWDPGSIASLLPLEFAELKDRATLIEKILADQERVIGGREVMRGPGGFIDDAPRALVP
jgi:hypothetical protein